MTDIIYVLKSKLFTGILCLFFMLFFSSCSKDSLVVSCLPNNDLYVILVDNNISCVRYDTPEDAIREAGNNAGVMILADNYPNTPTVIDPALLDLARDKKLKLYIEYPSDLPGLESGEIRRTHWERAVVSSEAFEPAIHANRILAIHDCHFIPMNLNNPDMVVARVAGMDSALYGLPKAYFPILASYQTTPEDHPILVSTTKLSQFQTARYAPTEAWQAVWEYILTFLLPEAANLKLQWKANVRPAYSKTAALPELVEKEALTRGIDWFFNSRMLLHPDMMEKYNKPSNDPHPASAAAVLEQDWAYGHRTDKMVAGASIGDGSLGILEGFDAKIFYDGSQAVRWWSRADCNGEIAGAMSLAGKVLGNDKYLKTALNLANWLFFKSMMTQGKRMDPQHDAYGLIGWNDSPKYAGPAYGDGFGVYYGDDNARTMLGIMLAAATQNTDHFDERLMMGLLGNLRLSGVNGFQSGGRIDQGPLEKDGWKSYFRSDNISLSPHYQSYLFACYLWAYHKTGYDLFLTRAKKGIKLMMEGYPDKWSWTNGIQQERARMLLPLSWLVRIEDTPGHREWLKVMTNDILKYQDECGAIYEQIGEAGKGGFPPPSSNERYGTTEAPLIQTNTDRVSDLLYTTNFAFLGLHEAAYATNDVFYHEAEDKLAAFLCRIQIESEEHQELRGGWFRAFDFNRWEYWASNADSGWGAWSIQSGWTQSWITAVLGLRQIESSLWDITKESRINEKFAPLKPLFFKD